MVPSPGAPSGQDGDQSNLRTQKIVLMNLIVINQPLFSVQKNEQRITPDFDTCSSMFLQSRLHRMVEPRS